MPPEPASPSAGGIHVMAVTYLGALGGIAGGVAAVASRTVGWNIWLWSGVALVIVVGVSVGKFDRFLDLAYRSAYRRIVHRNRQLNELQLLGARQPAGPTLRVGDVYIDVKLRTKQPGGRDHPGFGPTAEAGGRRKKLDELLRHSGHRAFSVRGRPGDGKTTLLRATAIRLTQPWRVLRPLPVLVVLPRHVGAISGDVAIGLAEIAMAEPWLRNSAITVEHMRKWLKGRRVVVMLDGLDEVDEAHRANVIKWVDQITADNFQGSLIIAGRPLGFNSAVLARAPAVLDICSLTRDQMRLFIRRCFAAARKSRDYAMSNPTAQPGELMAQLDDNPHVFDLAMTPMLLHIIVYRHIYRPRGVVGSRAQLYEEFIEILLHTRRSGAGAGDVSSDPDFLEKLAIMRLLAFELMLDQDRIFSALEKVTAVLNRLGVDRDPQTVVDDARQHGLLVTAGGSNSAFAHLSFQEYLAASHIVAEGLSELLIENINSGWWRNTTILWAAQIDPGPVIAASQRKGGGDGWDLAIACANEAAARGFVIDANLSRRIEDFLEFDHPHGGDEYYVACTEVIRRNLQEIKPLDETPVCRRPVELPLWRLREKSERRGHRYSSAYREGPDASLRGLWPSEVLEFLNWLNTFDHRGFKYRLPSAKEGRSIVGKRWNRRDAVGIWVQGRTRVEAQYRKGGGFTTDRARLDRLLGSDWSEVVGSLGPLQGRPGMVQKSAAQRVAAALVELRDSVNAAREAVKSSLPDRGAYADTQAAQQQSNKIGLLLARVESMADRMHEAPDLTTMLDSVRELRSVAPVQPVGGLKPMHLTRIKRCLKVLQGSIVTAYDKSFLDLQGRIRNRKGAPAPLAAAAALQLAPVLALDHRQKSVPDPMPASSATRIAAAAEGLTTYPENVLGELDKVIGPLRARVRGSGDRAAAQALVDMLAAVRAAIEPSLGREVPLDRAALRIARLALVGVATRLEVENASGDVFQECCRCIVGLAVLEMRESGTITVNEVLVLVREDR